ncbi:MAG TPA: metal-sulfur cluster assembly factor [Casimicrobiaceae bacterium]|nr:metal-sulfur cluster assembly factor [Casimicrobiaceae bacterium]
MAPDLHDVPDHDGILAAIATVIDPEAGMNVVDLGLIYDAALDGDRVSITMTMTTPACPVGDYLADAVRDAVAGRYPSLESVDVTITFDPPWTPDRMSDAARAKFGW